MGKTALVLVTEGTEEIEAVVTIDVLRRAGVEVTVAGVAGAAPVTCARSTVLVPDAPLEKAAKQGPFDAVILPGGLQGAQNFCKSALVKAVLLEQEASGRLLAAICAAPTALKAHGVCAGRTVTSYPNFRDEMVQAGFKYSEQRVVIDGNLVTSRGPGTAFEFALALVSIQRAAAVSPHQGTAAPLSRKRQSSYWCDWQRAPAVCCSCLAQLRQRKPRSVCLSVCLCVPFL